MIDRRTFAATLLVTLLAGLTGSAVVGALAGAQAPTAASAPRAGDAVAIGLADCTAERVGTTIPVDRIGEPVRGVTLAAPAWTPETATAPAHCRVDGVIEAIDTAATARPINFSVALPAAWNRRAVQLGGGGLNGVVPNLTGGAGGGPPPRGPNAGS